MVAGTSKKGGQKTGRRKVTRKDIHQAGVEGLPALIKKVVKRINEGDAEIKAQMELEAQMEMENMQSNRKRSP